MTVGAATAGAVVVFSWIGFKQGDELAQVFYRHLVGHDQDTRCAGYINDGREPYPGITAETCEISPDIGGENILLVDDIYTPGVNVDEDASKAGALETATQAIRQIAAVKNVWLVRLPHGNA